MVQSKKSPPKQIQVYSHHLVKSSPGRKVSFLPSTPWSGGHYFLVILHKEDRENIGKVSYMLSSWAFKGSPPSPMPTPRQEI